MRYSHHHGDEWRHAAFAATPGAKRCARWIPNARTLDRREVVAQLAWFMEPPLRPPAIEYMRHNNMKHRVGEPWSCRGNKIDNQKQSMATNKCRDGLCICSDGLPPFLPTQRAKKSEAFFRTKKNHRGIFQVQKKSQRHFSGPKKIIEAFSRAKKW